MICRSTVFFMSHGERMQHPAGDGRRDLLTLEDSDDIIALYLPTLELQVYPRSVWVTLRPKSVRVDDPRLLIGRIRAKECDLVRQRAPFDADTVTRFIVALQEMLPPLPPARTRTRAVRV